MSAEIANAFAAYAGDTARAAGRQYAARRVGVERASRQENQEQRADATPDGAE